MALTDTSLRNLKQVTRPTKLYDTLGLFLLLNPQSVRNPKGSRLWRVKYYFGGKEKLLALGAYPDLPLKLAREQRDKVRELLARGIDPDAQRKADTFATREAASNNFEAIAREWLQKQESKLDPVTYKKAVAIC